MAQIKTITAIAAIAALTGGLISHHFFSHSDAGTTISIASESSNVSSAKIQDPAYDALQRENQYLRSQLAVHNCPSQATISSQASTSSIPNQENLEQKIVELEAEKQLRKASDFSKWIMESQKSNASFDLNGELQNRFEQEARDPVWAEQKESQYSQLFSSKERLREFAFRNTQCRSKQCEVTVSISNGEQAHQLLKAMSETLQGSTILIATDEQLGTSRLYISSNEKGFEFNWNIVN